MGPHPFYGRHGAEELQRGVTSRASQPWEHWYRGPGAPLRRRNIELRVGPPPSLIEGGGHVTHHEQRATRVGFVRHVFAWLCVQIATLFAFLARLSAGKAATGTRTIPVPRG